MVEEEAWCAAAASSPRRSLQHEVDAPQLCALLTARCLGRVVEALEGCLLRGPRGVCDADHGQEGGPSLPPTDEERKERGALDVGTGGAGTPKALATARGGVPWGTPHMRVHVEGPWFIS